MAEDLGYALFVGACALLVYSYIMYPCATFLFARLAGQHPAEGDWDPHVSLIITARNEERDIAGKLENTLGLDYPMNRLEIIVSSDASSDRTDDIVRTYEGRGVRLVCSAQRSGKTAATQRALQAARGEVLVFSDATGMYRPDAVRQLVRALSNPSVGCVSGRVEYSYGESFLARGFRLYQRFVKALRRQESACGVLTSVSGSIHALRRDRFPIIDPHQNYDLLLPIEMAHRGLRIRYESEAVSHETARTRTTDEFQARVRAAIAAFAAFSELRRRNWLLKRPLFLWALLSSKILRWLTPLWLLALLCGHLLLAWRPGLWRWLLVPHLGFYAVSGLAAALPPSRSTRALAGPLFVCTVCAAFLVGLVRYLAGERAAAWDTRR